MIINISFLKGKVNKNFSLSTSSLSTFYNTSHFSIAIITSISFIVIIEVIDGGVSALLEGGGEADVELAAGQVVGDGVLDVVDVGDPVVAAHVADVHEVEAVEAEPDLLEVAEQAR